MNKNDKTTRTRKQKTVYSNLLNDIITGIKNGNIKPGEWLLGENAFAKKYNISRVSVRTAIKILVSKGLAESIAGKGTKIKNTCKAGLSEVVILFRSEMLNDLQTNSYYFRIRQEIENLLSQKGIIIKNIQYNDESDSELFWNNVLFPKSTGVIFLAEKQLKGLPPLSRIEGPIIQVDHKLSELNADSVEIDSIALGSIAARSLLDYGHQEIALIDWEKSSILDPKKREGIQQELINSNLTLQPRFDISSTMDIEGGKNATAKLLSQSEPPTAIITYSSNMAKGAIAKCIELGKNVPDDISIISMGDDYSSNNDNTYLTRMDPNIPGIANLTISQLINRFSSPNAPQAELFQSAKLILGKTIKTREKND